jgi:hypothetical protein
MVYGESGKPLGYNIDLPGRSESKNNIIALKAKTFPIKALNFGVLFSDMGYLTGDIDITGPSTTWE